MPFKAVANFWPAEAQLNVCTKPSAVLMAILSQAAIVLPRWYQSIVRIMELSPVAMEAPRLYQLIPVKSRYRVLTRVLTPVPKVAPMVSQLILDTKELMVLVSPDTNPEMAPPALSQEIRSFRVIMPRLIAPAIYSPTPSQSWPLIRSTKPLIQVGTSTSSNISVGVGPLYPPPPADPWSWFRLSKLKAFLPFFAALSASSKEAA